MDLSAINEASLAVKKILKDYQPIERLDEALAKAKAVLSQVGDLEAARAAAQGQLAKVKAEQAAAEARLTQVRRETAEAQAVLDRVKAALSSIKV